MAASKLPMKILAEQILPRLPAKSVVRFICLCKSFQTLISTSEFIHRHLRHSVSSDDNRLLILVHKGYGINWFNLDRPEFPAVHLPIPRSTQVEGFFVVGSCNGLICIGTPFSSLTVCNPCTGIYKEIYNFAAPGCLTNYGFGYDDVNDDYKVVRLTDQTFHNGSRYMVRRMAEVYSLKLDCWSMVEVGSGRGESQHLGSAALIESHLLHWRYCHIGYGTYQISCFDLRNNRWGNDVPLPDFSVEIDTSKRTYLVHLGVLDGCLCLMTSNYQSIEDDLWVMKNYGVKDSWVKLASISFMNLSPPWKISPVACAKGSQSEILMIRKDSPSKLFWYNIGDKTLRWPELHDVPAYYEACISKGSIVSIPGGVSFKLEYQGITDSRIQNDGVGTEMQLLLRM